MLRLTFLVILNIAFNHAYSQGSCVSGNCQDGKGTYKYDNGDSYTGNFKGGFTDGHGVLISKTNGYTYTGDFSGGLIHGKGVFEFVDGSSYSGDVY